MAAPAAEQPAEDRAAEAYGRLPLSFEANHGQTDSGVHFISRGNGYSLFLTSTEAVLTLGGDAAAKPRGEASASDGREPKPEVNSPAVLRMKMVASNPDATVAGLDELPGKVSYYIGNNPDEWHTNIPTFARVQYTEVYPGIDLVYHGNRGQLEYDFELAPGADPSSIRLAFEGATRVSVNGEGDLVVETAGGPVVHDAPTIYQEIGGARKEVDGRYVLSGKNEVGFEVGGYDAARPLVIDPTLTYSTFLGGNDNDYAYDIAVDTAGNAYVTGETDSTNFPQALLRPGNVDAFVAKLNAAGTALLYSIYLGGSDREGSGDQKHGGIAVDSSGNAYVTGLTWSQNFPVKNAYQNQRNGYSKDAFVTKLGPTGALLYSTYFGGTGGDEGDAIAVDSARNIYLVGRTTSDDLKTHNAYQATNKGGSDFFLTKFNAAGSALLYSTYFGTGSYDSEAVSLAIDSTSNAYLASTTNSGAFPTTANAYRRQINSYQNDAIVAKFLTTAAGAASLVYSSYLGGSSTETAYDIAADATGNAYVTGETDSNDFPTKNAFQSVYGGGWGDAFVTKLNTKPGACTQTATDNCRESLLYSTYLGGSNGEDAARGIAADSQGNVYVTGSTGSRNFPVRSPIQATKTDYSWDVFVSKLNTKAVGSASLVHSTFLLGTSADRGRAIALDSALNMYVTGNTTSTDFLKKNPYQPVKGNYSDAFITKISDQAVLTSLTVTPSIVLGSTSATGKVTLSAPAPALGAKVTLTDTLAAAAVPASVTIPAGATYKTFTVTTALVSALQSGNVTAAYGGISKSALLKVRPIGVASLTVAPNPVVGPNKATGTVTLELPAAPGNITVTLTSSNPSVASPAVSSMVIPAGVKSKTFTVNTADVLSPGSATIRATANGVFKTFLLRVN